MADINHINHSIYPRAHTSMYVWHKYWARKTWNVVGEYIETYCSKDCIVLDPFSGSGVVGIEAVKRGRRAISIDLNPFIFSLQLCWPQHHGRDER